LPSIAQHPSASVVKLLLVGDSGAGKTGALAALAASGYNLRIWDFDNGLDILRNYATRKDSPYVAKCPDVASRIEYVTCTDEMKNVGGNIQCIRAHAWQRAVSMLDHWRELGPDGKTVVKDLGKITTWGQDDVLCVDTLTTAAIAAKNFHLQLNGKLGQTRTSNEHRRDIGAAQGAIQRLLEMLYSDSIKCNVVVTTHITTVTESGMAPNAEEAKDERDTARGYPSVIGRALSPLVSRWFNSVLYVDVAGSGASAKHKLYTRTQGNVLVKTSSPLSVRPSYDLEWGLAEYFKDVKGGTSN
jgi:hypothetical protein